MIEIGAASPRQNDAVGFDRTRQAPQNDRFRHQRSHLHANVEHIPTEGQCAETPHEVHEPRMGEMPCQEQKTFGHEIVISPTRAKARQTLRLIGLGFKLLDRADVGLGPLFVAVGLIGRRAARIGLGVVRIELQRLGIIGDGAIHVAALGESVAAIDIKPNVLGIDDGAAS